MVHRGYLAHGAVSAVPRERWSSAMYGIFERLEGWLCTVLQVRHFCTAGSGHLAQAGTQGTCMLPCAWRWRWRRRLEGTLRRFVVAGRGHAWSWQQTHGWEHAAVVEVDGGGREGEWQSGPGGWRAQATRVDRWRCASRSADARRVSSGAVTGPGNEGLTDSES